MGHVNGKGDAKSQSSQLKCIVQYPFVYMQTKDTSNGSLFFRYFNGILFEINDVRCAYWFLINCYEEIY